MRSSSPPRRRELDGPRWLSTLMLLLCLPPLPGLSGCAARASGSTVSAPAEAPSASASGRAAPETEPADGDGSVPAAAASDPAPEPGQEDDGLDADIAALSASTHTGAPPAPASASPAPTMPSSGREIVYRVTPKGLVIEIDGVHLRPEAKPFRYESGAYGIDLVVNVESFDGRQYWVSKPKEGPPSIAGKVESGKAGAGQGTSARFADQREGSGEEAVLEGHPQRFKQRWPGRGQPKLWAGQTVTLEVGLWGVRAESERERPVRRLFVVKMVAGPRSQAVITPPTMDWGT